METYEFTIDAASTDIGTRLDKYLTEQIPDQSRSYIQKLLDDNFITVNGKSAKSNYKLRAGDTITVEIPEAEELDIEPENIPLDIVYEDDDIIVINKPKGMVVHPAPGHTSGTLVNALMYHCKDSLSSINGVLRPGIVHRIDMDTTGLLVACKSDQAHRVLSDKFKVHDIHRVYTAIVYNQFATDEGTINKPIARHKTDRKKMAIDPNGRHIRSGCIWQASIIHCLGMRCMDQSRSHLPHRGRYYTQGYSDSTTQSPENIWNGMQTFQTIFRRF